MLRRNALILRWIAALALSFGGVLAAWPQDPQNSDEWQLLSANRLIRASKVRPMPGAGVWTVTETPGRERTIRWDECIAVMRRTRSAAGELPARDTLGRRFAIQMLNGERLLLSKLAFTRDRACGNHPLLGRFEVDTGRIAWIALPRDGGIEPPKTQVAGVLLRNGDSLPGSIVSISGQTVVVEMDQIGKVPVNGFSSMAHLVFNVRDKAQSAQDGSGSACILMDSGDMLFGDLTDSDDTMWLLKTRWQARPLAIPDAWINAVYLRQGRSFLSDNEPRGVKETPFLGGMAGYRRNCSLSGRSLAVNGFAAVKGLAMQSRTELEYELGPLSAAPMTFVCSAGMDDDGRYPAAQAEILFSLNGEPAGKKTISAGKDPVPVHLPVPAGTKSVGITVDYGTGGSAGDHVDLLWPVLVPAREDASESYFVPPKDMGTAPK